MKRPKRVVVLHQETTETYSIYTCPHCSVSITGAGISKHVSRFKCLECGEECIVDSHLLKKNYGKPQ